MIKKLHPTLRACKCGKIMTRTQLYSHLDHEEKLHRLAHLPSADFYLSHGEVPLNEDDPRLNVENQLARSVSQEETSWPNDQVGDNVGMNFSLNELRRQKGKL